MGKPFLDVIVIRLIGSRYLQPILHKLCHSAHILLEDYQSNPPSLCFRNSTVCGQGHVPLLGVNATTAAHIQVMVYLTCSEGSANMAPFRRV